MVVPPSIQNSLAACALETASTVAEQIINFWKPPKIKFRTRVAGDTCVFILDVLIGLNLLETFLFFWALPKPNFDSQNVLHGDRMAVL